MRLSFKKTVDGYEGNQHMQKSYALFDFDGTLLRGDSLVQFCGYAHRQGLCTSKQLRRGIGTAFLYVLGLRTAEQSKIAALSFIVGRTEAQLQDVSARFWEDALRRRMRRQGLEALKQRKAEGAEVLLVTASPAFYLEPVRVALGITAVIGTRMDIGTDGRATGMICGQNCKGVQKPLRLAEYLAASGERLDYDSSYAYGDSHSDAPMLELCGHKVAVNAKRKLRKKLHGLEGATFVRWKE